MALTSPEPIGVWWKGKVKLEGRKIVPIDKNPYNPFEYYFPAGVRTPKNEGTRSLPYLFLQVDASDSEEILSFCEQYGVLGDFSLDGWKALARIITGSLPNRQEKPSHGAYEKLMAEGLRERSTSLLDGLPPLASALARPMTTFQFQRAQRDLQETVEWLRKAEESQGNKTNREARQKVELRFRAKLAMLRPYVAWDRELSGWVTGWDAGSLESLLYLMLLYDCQGGGQIKACPWCKKVYMADRPKMTYCSPACGNNYRVTKHRRKQHGTIKGRKEKS